MNVIQIDPYDSFISKIKLMEEIVMIDNLPITRFKNICDFNEFIDLKSDKKESLMITLKDGRLLEIPFREKITRKM